MNKWLRIDWDKAFVNWREMDFNWLFLDLCVYKEIVVDKLKKSIVDNLTLTNNEDPIIFDTSNGYKDLWRTWQHIVSMIAKFFKSYSLHKLLLKNNIKNKNYANESIENAADLCKVAKNPKVIIFWADKIKEIAEDLKSIIEEGEKTE